VVDATLPPKMARASDGMITMMIQTCTLRPDASRCSESP
jgi:hypothetical protein